MFAEPLLSFQFQQLGFKHFYLVKAVTTKDDEPGSIFGYFEKHMFEVKTSVVTFRQLLK